MPIPREAALPAASALTVRALHGGTLTPGENLIPSISSKKKMCAYLYKRQPAALTWRVKATGHIVKAPVVARGCRDRRQECSARPAAGRGLMLSDSSLRTSSSGRTLTRIVSEMGFPGAGHSDRFPRGSEWPSTWYPGGALRLSERGSRMTQAGAWDSVDDGLAARGRWKRRAWREWVWGAGLWRRHWGGDQGSVTRG